MRQLAPVTNLVLAIVSGFLLLPVLGLPFFARAGSYESEGIERSAEQIRRWFTVPANPTTGTEALGDSRTILLGIAAATAVLCLLMAIGPLRRLVRDVLKVVPMLAPALLFVQLFNQPGEGGQLEVRYGLFVGIAVAAFMASAAFHGSRLPDPKPAPKPYTPPPGPAGSQAPPGF